MSEFKHMHTYDDLTEEHRKTLEEGLQLCGEATRALWDLQNYIARNTVSTGEHYTSLMGLEKGRDAVKNLKNAIMARGLEPLMAVTTRVEKG